MNDEFFHTSYFILHNFRDDDHGSRLRRRLLVMGCWLNYLITNNA
jgi:hypothetical protein